VLLFVVARIAWVLLHPKVTALEPEGGAAH
jgi:hypothetical protein